VPVGRPECGYSSDFVREKVTEVGMKQDSSEPLIQPVVSPSSAQSSEFPADASERLQLALDAGAIIGTWVWDIPDDRVTSAFRAHLVCPWSAAYPEFRSRKRSPPFILTMLTAWR
jgi:hypothetical protein